jgi:hypothetical protein
MDTNQMEFNVNFADFLANNGTLHQLNVNPAVSSINTGSLLDPFALTVNLKVRSGITFPLADLAHTIITISMSIDAGLVAIFNKSGVLLPMHVLLARVIWQFLILWVLLVNLVNILRRNGMEVLVLLAVIGQCTGSQIQIHVKTVTI